MFGPTIVQVVSVLTLAVLVFDRHYANMWRQNFLIWLYFCFIVGAIPTSFTGSCHWFMSLIHSYIGWYALLVGTLLLLNYGIILAQR